MEEGKAQNSQDFRLGRRTLNDDFFIGAGEEKVIDFKFSYSKIDSDDNRKEKVRGNLENPEETSRFTVEVSVDVKKVLLNPNAIQTAYFDEAL